MKKILLYTLLTCATLCSSCESEFDPQIYGKLFPSNFPKTESDYESFLMTCYVPFGNTWNYNLSGAQQHTMYIPEGGMWRMLDSTSDICFPWTVGNWGGGWLKMTQANYSDFHLNGRGSSGGSPSHYEKIRDVTRFTNIIGTIEAATTLTESKKKEFLGEAHLLRGLMMYYLLHIYGPVPVIMNPSDVGNLEAEQNLVRPTLEQMVKYIYDDLDFAQQNMSNTGPHGRYTADYAKFCLMRHCLNEGNYDKAIDMYTALKADGKYSLFTTGGADAYANQFKQAYKFNAEVIMAISVSESGDGSNSKGDFNPFEFYVVPTNVARTDPNGNPTPFFNMGGGWGQCFNVSPLFYDTYEDRDARKNVVLTSYYRNDGTLLTRNEIGTGWSGFIINKYPVEKATANNYQPTDVPLARWADVLLMYAEATARKTNAVPTGDALKAVNDVRARAGLDPLSGAAIASYDGFMDALLAERGHELLWEGHRKIDLVRFNKYRHNCKLYKGSEPTHQYIPLPDYAIQQAESYGKTLTQEFSRTGWEQDQ